jgi:Tfp pilus assembly protein PilF
MFLLFLLSFSSLYAQDSTNKVLMDRGIALHDKGDYEGAIKIYDEVMRIDANHYLAHYEKSYSLLSAGKYDECIDLCKQVLKQFPDGQDNSRIYDNYGSALDILGKSKEAIKIYNKGIKQYPDFYLLRFNRAITEYTNKDYDAAEEDLKKAITLNPFHTSSHIYLAYIESNKNRIAAAMAISVALLLETKGTRTFKNLGILEQLLGSNVKKGNDDKTINITLASPSKKHGEDDFHLAEMMMSLTEAASYTEEGKSRSAEEKLQLKLSGFTTLEPEKKGFFSNFYVPFFAEMKEKDYLETACYVIYISSGNAQNKEWLADNPKKIEALYKWINEFKWNKG